MEAKNENCKASSSECYLLKSHQLKLFYQINHIKSYGQIKAAPKTKMSSIIYENPLPLRDCGKLYLNGENADIFFVLKTSEQDCVKIPAHKSVLSVTSPIFDAMFYGASTQVGDIEISGSTPEAFKEFLQFFYRSTVKLSDQNLAEVMNLVKKYELDDCFNECSEVCELTLTLDNLCWGYDLAILFEHEDLILFCEQKISENSRDIFRSTSFLNCDLNLLHRILQLESLNCDESAVFDGCIAWAKTACVRKDLNKNDMQNIRTQLGDQFYEIRFGEMNLEDFYDRYCFYRNLFSLDEFEDIISMIAMKNFQSGKFNQSPRIIKNCK